MNRYTKETAVNNIRDYYNPAQHEAATGKQREAFERAKSEYIAALKSQIATAEQIGFVDVFPNAQSESN